MQGEDLRAVRKGLGWTMEKLAGEIGMTKTFVGMMERGERPIEKRTALAVNHIALTAKFVTMREDLMMRTDLMKAGVFRLTMTDQEGVHDQTDEAIARNEEHIAEFDDLIARGQELVKTGEQGANDTGGATV